VHIRQMAAADISLGMRLKTQNHWNQLETDWQRQLALEPAGCFVAETAGQPVGTACCCVFETVAWINLVLVDRDQRGQGIGTALLRHVIDYLDQRGVPCIRLDATPLGQVVYEKLGFVGEFTLARFEGTLPAASTEPVAVVPLLPADVPAVLQLDEAVTQTRREKLLRHLYDVSPSLMRKYASGGRLEGFCLVRPGSNAWQLGPIQGSAAAGRSLLHDLAQRFAGQKVYLDVPIDHAEAVAMLESLGLTVQRRFLRMGRGQRLQEDLTRFWSSFGPEKG
jgi:GNAT superfamily N-acetyltransferase